MGKSRPQLSKSKKLRSFERKNEKAMERERAAKLRRDQGMRTDHPGDDRRS